MNKKVILIVRDGWGYREDKEKNFVKLAKTPNTDRLEKEYPTIYIGASEEFVGLPKGFVGNSEVGHMTLGSGQILKQSLSRINESIESGEFSINSEILKAINNVKKNKTKLHLMILMQDAGVHAHISHLFEVMRFAKKEGLKNEDVYIHLITDGRDEDPKSGLEFLDEVSKNMEEMKLGRVATISGRYYAMDRNKNWERTEKYYDAVVSGVSEEIFDCGKQAIFNSYENEKITDEFMTPKVKENYGGLKDNDSLIFLNFRKDRPRQITQALIEKDFQGFLRKEIKNIYFLSMTRYYKEQKSSVIFEDEIVENTLGKILEENKKTQLRIAETEKFAHVTFFFDGGVKKDFSSKKEILIPSPDVETYDLQPEMSAKEVTKTLLAEIKNSQPDFILVNYANPDMVGHTGNFEAIQKAVETVDEEIGRLVEVGIKNEYSILLTADHGNVDDKREETRTTHTMSLVPLTIISNKENLERIDLKKIKGLADIKQIILDFMDLR